MVKVTFTLDEATIDRLNRAATRRAIPKSQAVHEAIKDYHAKADQVSEEERQRRVKAFREYLALIPKRPQAEVEKELAEKFGAEPMVAPMSAVISRAWK